MDTDRTNVNIRMKVSVLVSIKSAERGMLFSILSTVIKAV